MNATRRILSSPCVCGTQRVPEVWEIQDSHGRDPYVYVRCPSCRRGGELSAWNLPDGAVADGQDYSGYNSQGEATQHRLVKLTLYSSQELLDELRRRLPPA